MNIILPSSNIDTSNISFLDTKKNIIIDGKFTKIVYTDPSFSMNGIYTNFPLQLLKNDKSVNRHFAKFIPNTPVNMQLLREANNLEVKIIEHYKKEHNINKSQLLILFNQLNNGKIKLYNDTSITGPPCTNNTNTSIILKISGIWETANEIGINYKFIEASEFSL